jgi:Rieske Fe-S protein
MNRRLFLKLLLAIPVLGSLGLFFSPFVRYLRPTLGPMANTVQGMEMNLRSDGDAQLGEAGGGPFGLVAPKDEPLAERDIIFKLSQFPKPWSFAEFNFAQRSKEYTFQHFQTTRTPGYVVRLPDNDKGEKQFMAVSRICPHMGCVFNFLEDPKAVEAYNYPNAKNPMFACPCHLSVYDPLEFQMVGNERLRGKVVSGPAPRPPFTFIFTENSEELVITSVEQGGIS